jgi:hypothetical protein
VRGSIRTKVKGKRYEIRVALGLVHQVALRAYQDSRVHPPRCSRPRHEPRTIGKAWLQAHQRIRRALGAHLASVTSTAFSSRGASVRRPMALP